jgi:hypothetical protein
VDIPGGTGQLVALGDLGYLCSACHGTDPLTEITGSETGFTHPTITANANASSVTFAAGFGGTPTDSNQLNCESCHRAHDADTESGTYILETTATGTSVTGSGTAQTIMPGHAHDVFCIGCHTY